MKGVFPIAAAAVAALCLSPCSPADASNKGAGARAMMNKFAQCMVQRRPDFARRYVLNWGVPPSRSDLQEIASSACLLWAGSDVIELNMRDALFRGALAEQLIRRELAKADVIDPIPLPALEWPGAQRPAAGGEKGPRVNAAAAGKEAERRYAVAVSDNQVMPLGECVVRADPAGSRTALLTEMDSADELARMKAMSPTIARCIAQGATPKFNRTILRAALAISYYRLAAAARVTPAGGAS